MDQIRVLKKITGEKKLEQALSLSDLVRELAIKNIKTHLGKKSSPKTIQKELRQRLLGS